MLVGARRMASRMSRECSPLVVERVSRFKVSRAGHPQSILNSNRYAKSDVITSLVRHGRYQSKVHYSRTIPGVDILSPAADLVHPKDRPSSSTGGIK